MAGPPIPLIGASSKPKKDEKTYIFELQIGESNEETYPEFSWKDLVAADQAKQRLASSGKTLLDPYASDDEDNLKAMAAKFEKKYAKTHSSKRKRRAEDYIDRGAGYDETDSFIDNSDVYDEVVPADLETVRGGFYINSGSLDFKEVHISEEEDDGADVEDEVTPSMVKKNGKSSNGNVVNSSGSKNSEKLERPSLVVPKKGLSVSSKTKSEHHSILKSKGTGSSNKSVVPSVTKVTTTTSQIEDVPKKTSSDNESPTSESTSSESSSSDGSSSSSSDSSSSGEEEEDLTDFKDEKSKKQLSKDGKKLVAPTQRTPITTPIATTTTINISTTEPPVKRLKTKNVPPNPNLPKNKILNKGPPSLININNSKDSMIVTSTSSPSSKLITYNSPIQAVTPISAVSNLGLTISSSGLSASNIKVPTPKTTPTSHSNSNATNLMGLNLVKHQQLQQQQQQLSASSASVIVPKQKSLKSKQLNLSNSLLNDPLLQNPFNLAALAAQSTGASSKKKPKLTKMTTNSTRNSLGSKQQPPPQQQPQQPTQQQQQQQQQRPPKLKARPRLKPMVPLNLPSSIQSTSNLSQSLPSFSRPSQPPSLASQRVEITKIKPVPAHSNSPSHHQLSASMKSLSSLGTGIFPVTVTEVKDKVGGSSASSSFPGGSGTTSSPRSRSPNVSTVFPLIQPPGFYFFSKKQDF